MGNNIFVKDSAEPEKKLKSVENPKDSATDEKSEVREMATEETVTPEQTIHSYREVSDGVMARVMTDEERQQEFSN